MSDARPLPRVLRRFALFAVAFSIVSITTGIFVNYGYGLTQLGPAAVGALGIVYTAVGVPGIMLVGMAPLVTTVLGLDTTDGRLLVFVAVLALLVAYLLNIVRVQLAAQVNNVAVFAEIIGTVVLSAVVFFAWVQGGAGTPDGGHGFGFLFTVTTDQPIAAALVGGALVGVFMLVGFEAAADLGEEAVDARRSVPRAMIASVLVSGVPGMVALVGFTIAIPDLPVVAGSPVPLAVIAEYWLGPVATKVFLAIVAFSMFALAVVAAAAGSRLLYAMARDGLLPFSTALSRVHPATGTLLVALLAALGLCLALLGFGAAFGDAFGVLVGATAIVPYLIYLLTLGAYVARRRRILDAGDGGFRPGGAGLPIAIAALVWIFAITVALTTSEAFLGADHVILGALVLAGLWYVAVVHRRLADGSAGVVTPEPEEVR